MPLASRRYIRNVVGALVLVGAAAWLLPSFFSAEHYRHRLEAGLQAVLHRPVTFGKVTYRLLPRPGFTIENVVIGEDPNFGSEPFARVDRIDCDLRWRSLWRSRLDFSRLALARPTLNLVRNGRGEWNFESLVLQSGLPTTAKAAPASVASRTAGPLQLTTESGRLSFQVGADKKPFAITELRAALTIDPAARRMRFRLAGSPVRTDISLPSPGEVELEGEWTPEKDMGGPVQATLKTRGGLLYDWVPLVSGHNPGLYGVLDAEVQVGGSLRLLNLSGDVRLTQLHRWEMLPPSDAWPWSMHFRGQFDRRNGRVLVDSLEASFGGSHLHLSGTVDKIPRSPALDLVLAVERSRLEDFVTLGRRLWMNTGAWGIKGRLDGMLTIQGPWAERRYGGFLGAREVFLNTPSGDFPVSDIAARIDEHGARVTPFRIKISLKVELVAEGNLQRKTQPPHYEVILSAGDVSLHSLLDFGRALGVPALRGLDAEGVTTATVHLAGSAWPLARPALTVRAQLSAARLLIPGLTEPLNLPRVNLRVNGDEIVADPLVAVMGTTVFTARLVHRGERKAPWEFDVRANSLSVDQGALWFDALGRRRPLPLLDRIPGLSSFDARRAAASALFSNLNSRGRFTAPLVTYRALTLKDFHAAVAISGRQIQVSKATFLAAGGHGQGSGKADLNVTPPVVAADVSVTGASVPSFAAWLPPGLHNTRGSISGSAHLATRGLTREEMSRNLQGQATGALKDISFGDFDPLNALARAGGLGKLEPPHCVAAFHSATVKLDIQDRHLSMRDLSLDLAGAKLGLSGTYTFGGPFDLDVRLNLSNSRRRWLTFAGRGDENDPERLHVELRLAGPLDKLSVVPFTRLSSARP